MVRPEELREIAKRVVNEIVQAYRGHRLVEYVDNALDIRVCKSLIGNEWVTETVELQVTTGGPNTWVRVDENKIVGEVYWGTLSERYEHYTREASDILDILEDILAHI